jgi:hypothetical protein
MPDDVSDKIIHAEVYEQMPHPMLPVTPSFVVVKFDEPAFVHMDRRRIKRERNKAIKKWSQWWMKSRITAMVCRRPAAHDGASAINNQRINQSNNQSFTETISVFDLFIKNGTIPPRDQKGHDLGPPRR